METKGQTQEEIKNFIKTLIAQLGEACDLGDYNTFSVITHEIITNLFALEDLKEAEIHPLESVTKALDSLEHIYDNELQKVIMKEESLNEVYEDIVSSLQEVVE